MAPWSWRGASRVLLEYSAYLSRLGLRALAAEYSERAATTRDEEGKLSLGEAQQLANQLALLQERREE
eukprot:4590610-Pleurochrysis_carterae.AAC.1